MGNLAAPEVSCSPMHDIREAILAGASGEEICRPAPPRDLPGGLRPAGRGRHVRRGRLGRQGPPEVPPRGRGGRPRAGPRRGLRGRHGLLHQLQHRLDLDLRAPPHLRLPRPPGPGVASGGPAMRCRTTWSAPTPPGWSSGWARSSATSRPATRSPSTATTSTTRTPRPTTTPCWRPTSGSGASRPTSAAWPTWPWSRPTSSCPRPPT